jgi:hypothetical protein
VAVVFIPSLALGAWLAAISGVRDRLSIVTRWILWIQLAIGAGLLLFWALLR